MLPEMWANSIFSGKPWESPDFSEETKCLLLFFILGSGVYRSVYSFKLAFIKLRCQNRITWSQVIFLYYLPEAAYY